jgi:hypothetical protein
MALDVSNCDALRRVNDKHPLQQFLALIRDRHIYGKLAVQIQDPLDHLSRAT